MGGVLGPDFRTRRLRDRLRQQKRILNFLQNWIFLLNEYFHHIKHHFKAAHWAQQEKTFNCCIKHYIHSACPLQMDCHCCSMPGSRAINLEPIWSRTHLPRPVILGITTAKLELSESLWICLLSESVVLGSFQLWLLKLCLRVETQIARIHLPVEFLNLHLKQVESVWGTRVEKPSSMAIVFQVYKTKARDFCYFSSEALQSL